MSRWPVWAATPERASDTTGCSRLARGPRVPARPCLQVPLDCGQGGRAGSWCLGPRSVRTTLVMGGFPVRRGPPGRSEERNGRQCGSACRWPQVFHTQAIRLRPMTLFNPVFNRLTPIVIKRSKTQADEGLGPQPKAGDSSRRSWLCRSASAPSQQACEPVQDRCSGPCSRPRHAAAWRSRNRAPAGWVAWATNAITEGRARFRIGTQWFSRSGCWNRRASSGERAIAVESRIDKLRRPLGANHVSRAPESGWPTEVGKKFASGRTKLRDGPEITS